MGSSNSQYETTKLKPPTKPAWIPEFYRPSNEWEKPKLSSFQK